MKKLDLYCYDCLNLKKLCKCGNVTFFKVTDEKCRIRIRTKMSRIRNSATESGSGGQQIADPDPGGLSAGRLPVTIFIKSQEHLYI
jgi:hypothetical protein